MEKKVAQAKNEVDKKGSNEHTMKNCSMGCVTSVARPIEQSH